jgi:hypothetical protein
MEKTKAKRLEDQISDADRVIREHIHYASKMIDYRDGLIAALRIGTTPPGIPPKNPPGIPPR